MTDTIHRGYTYDHPHPFTSHRLKKAGRTKAAITCCICGTTVPRSGDYWRTGDETTCCVCHTLYCGCLPQERAARGEVRASDLLVTGECSPQCLLASGVDPSCGCRCDGEFHGALREVIIPAEESA